MTEAMERHVADVVSGRASARAGLNSLALDLQRILGNKAQLRYSVRDNSVSEFQLNEARQRG